MDKNQETSQESSDELYERHLAAEFGYPLEEDAEAKLNAKQRRASATIKPSKKHPSGRFPMPDRSHASQALRMLGRAKGLSSSDKAKIRARANRILSKGKKK